MPEAVAETVAVAEVVSVAVAEAEVVPDGVSDGSEVCVTDGVAEIVPVGDIVSDDVAEVLAVPEIEAVAEGLLPALRVVVGVLDVERLCVDVLLVDGVWSGV